MEAQSHTAAPTRPTRGDAPRSEGHGRRLSAAFEALEQFPALAESRQRVLRVANVDKPAVSEVVFAVESDVALVIAVLRIANRRHGTRRGRIATVPEAVEVLTTPGVEALAEAAHTYDFFERAPVWEAQPEHFRLHAITTQRAAERLAAEVSWAERDELIVAALLHDIGKLVLAHAYPGYPSQIHAAARTPEDRVEAERKALGVDHAMVGGVLARRWELPDGLAAAIERHHHEDAVGSAALIRLADQLAHYAQGHGVVGDRLLASARACGVESETLRDLLYELPLASNGRRRSTEPCPLSERELGVLKLLAQGMVYKQIAHEMSLSTSTVRTHLHNVYGKLGAVDRAQAVLMATERGWL